MSITFYSHERDAKLDPNAYDFDGPNFSNRNAGDILRYIGIECDPNYMVGEIEPDDLIARCITARAAGGIGQEDTGSPNIRVGNMIDCGRRPTYFLSAIFQLEARAEKAKRDGHVIIYA